MKKLLTLIIFFSFSFLGFSQQFRSVEIGVDGLTCSMCTRTTELNIRKLDFVDSVAMNLSNTNGVITFKKDSEIKLEKIAKAVTDAGFSVRYMKAEFTFEAQDIRQGNCFAYGKEQFKYLGSEDKTLSGPVKLTVVGKSFMPAKEYKKWSDKVKDTCSPDKKTYYVTT